MVDKTTKISGFPDHIKKKNRSELRKTLQVILERDLSKIKGKRILEIGCGDWDYAKKILEKNHCEWHGFEPVDLGESNLTLVKGSVKNIPYHSNSFDYVLCNQTMEHWFEYGVSFKKALEEINRVLKNDGIAMINVPIHVHGHPLFLSGKLKKIRHLFPKKDWNITLFEKCIPTVNEKKWQKIASRGLFSKFGYPKFLIPKNKIAYSYILNIHSIKIKQNKEIKRHYYNKFRPLLVILRFFKEYIFNIFIL